ncbi:MULTISPECIES: TrbL/VirB6 family protein [Sinorhizobium]|uniref:type IV secretion system protein n=1 Tax=Rhizobium meliloti TaxID=382 RepID=UPI000FD90763|nr:type IV secretion system protein [Sinorhizobium meliloti]MDW9713583.1 conjugal transfer protein TrbL [Sinorhizobium meliloti]MDW9750664.1 conjugal transfer protein TrbL [Sinorhizobium meliloti]MDX0359627.1 conjugal transfer protein TrbL [Sinorhizobium meliloti]RVG41611.1 type IV secretion system protein [Sinorhizobium meliloti]RVL75961.1 type IV secretion system protein [Sinorhizobium meliloti]
MHDFLGDLLDRIEQTGADFSEQAYGIVGDEIVPLLTIMFIAYVGYYGLQLFMGTARVSVSEIIGRVARMLIILALVRDWDYFNTLFYSWLNNTPEDVGRAILTATGTGITEPTNGLSMIWKTANEAASAFAEQSGYFAVLPSMIGFLIMLAVAVFIAVALAILLLAKVMMWVLIGTAPIFIGCMLFEQTRGMGVAWFQQVLMYALTPLFVYVVAAFLISAMDPELTKVTSAANQRELQLSDISAFLLLCAAGAFILFNIQVLAQGITGGVAAGIGNFARAVGRWTGVSAPISALSGGQRLAGSIGNAGMQARARTQEGMRTNIRNAAAESMQNRISSNSMPR